MHTRTVGTILLGLLTMLAPPILSLQRSGENPADVILDMMVWGARTTVDAASFAEPLRSEVSAHLTRAASYRSSRPVPTDGEMRMVNAAWSRYEQSLVSVTDDPRAPQLAAAYVDSLRPCYEWEGMSECPAREARFADEYINRHVDSPFVEYLPLLTAHRWLCAAELFEFEKDPEEARMARRRYDVRIAQALKAKSLVVRAAADRLAARRTCFAPR